MSQEPGDFFSPGPLGATNHSSLHSPLIFKRPRSCEKTLHTWETQSWDLHEKHPKAALFSVPDMHSPFPPPFPDVKDSPSELPTLETTELSVPVTVTCARHCSQGRREPRSGQANPQGRDASSPSFLDVVPGPRNPTPPQLRRLAYQQFSILGW